MSGKGYRKGKLFATKAIAVDEEVKTLIDKSSRPGERANDTIRRLLGLDMKVTKISETISGNLLKGPYGPALREILHQGGSNV